MSVELISVLVAVLAIGATLAGLILTSNRGLRQDLRQDMVRLDERIGGLEVRLREDMGKLESRLRDDIKQLGDRVGRVEHSQAKLEGAAGRVARGHHRAGQGQLGLRLAVLVVAHQPRQNETHWENETHDET